VIRALSFDLDNTLWEIEPVIRRAEETLWSWLSEHYPAIPDCIEADGLVALRQQTIDEFHHKAHDLRFVRKKMLQRMAERAGYDAGLVEPAFKVFDIARNEVELYADVLENLQALTSGFSLVALTNGNADLVRIGIDQFFKGSVTAADIGVAKPHARMFMSAANTVECQPDEVLHIGDNPEADIEGARRAGMRAAWINRAGHDWPDHLPRATVEVSNLHELSSWLSDNLDTP